jgi:hypothetical protein
MCRPLAALLSSGRPRPNCHLNGVRQLSSHVIRIPTGDSLSAHLRSPDEFILKGHSFLDLCCATWIMPLLLELRHCLSIGADSEPSAMAPR